MTNLFTLYQINGKEMLWKGKIQLFKILLPVLGIVRRPPSEPSVALALWLGSLGSVWPWWSLGPEPTVFRLMISPSTEPGPVGSSREDMVEELYTFIFRLGRGSSKGDVVIGILWWESSVACCKEKSGPRKVPALAVRSGGAVGCRRWGLSEKKVNQ